MILLEYHNRILHDTLQSLFKNPKKRIVDILISDFDGAKFHIWTDKDFVVISLSWACFNSLKGQGVMIGLKKNYGAFLAPKESGYDATLRVNPSKVEEPKKKTLPYHLAMLKRNVFASPFNKYFDAAAKNLKLPVLPIEYRPNEFVYLTNIQKRTLVIFKVMFKDKDDQTLAKVFLQEFTRSTGGAPSVSYSYRNPPGDIKGAKGAEESDDHGYVSFVLFAKHTSGKVRAKTVSNIQTFRNYLHYHIKCAKAYMHTRMRSRVSSLLKILNRAKTEPLVKVKRNIRGKVISRTRNK